MGVIVAAFLLLRFMIINVNAILGDCIYYNQCSNDLDCSETCISDYDSLELYVQNNKTIINDQHRTLLLRLFSAQGIHLQDLLGL